MADARFVYISDGAESAESTDGLDRVWWRLVAANNRVLGRLAGTAAGEFAARAIAQKLGDRIDEAVSTMSTDDRGQWTWTIALDGVDLAACAHPFARRVDCVRALALFTDGIRAADPYAGMVRYPSGGRYLPRASRLAVGQVAT